MILNSSLFQLGWCFMLGPSVFLEVVICFETFMASVAITTAADVLEIFSVC